MVRVSHWANWVWFSNPFPKKYLLRPKNDIKLLDPAYSTRVWFGAAAQPHGKNHHFLVETMAILEWHPIRMDTPGYHCHITVNSHIPPQKKRSPYIPSGKHTKNYGTYWNITIFHGKTHYFNGHLNHSKLSAITRPGNSPHRRAGQAGLHAIQDGLATFDPQVIPTEVQVSHCTWAQPSQQSSAESLAQGRERSHVANVG